MILFGGYSLIMTFNLSCEPDSVSASNHNRPDPTVGAGERSAAVHRRWVCFRSCGSLSLTPDPALPLSAGVLYNQFLSQTDFEMLRDRAKVGLFFTPLKQPFRARKQEAYQCCYSPPVCLPLETDGQVGSQSLRGCGRSVHASQSSRLFLLPDSCSSVSLFPVSCTRVSLLPVSCPLFCRVWAVWCGRTWPTG